MKMKIPVSVYYRLSNLLRVKEFVCILLFTNIIKTNVFSHVTQTIRVKKKRFTFCPILYNAVIVTEEYTNHLRFVIGRHIRVNV